MGLRLGAFAGGMAQGINTEREMQMKQDEMKRRQEEHDWKAQEQQRQQGVRDVVANGLASIGTDDYARSFSQLTGMTPEQSAVIQQAAAASGNAGQFMRDRLADSAVGDTASVMQLQPQQTTRGMAMKNIASQMGRYDADKALNYEKLSDDELTKEKVMQINSLFNGLDNGQITPQQFGKQAASLYNTGVNDGRYAGVFGDQMLVVDPKTGQGRALDLNNAEHRQLMRLQALMAIDPQYGNQYAQSLQHAIGNQQGERKLGQGDRQLDITEAYRNNQYDLGLRKLALEREGMGIERMKAGAMLAQSRQLNPGNFMEGTDANGQPQYFVATMDRNGNVTQVPMQGGIRPLPRATMDPVKQKQMDRWYKWVEENGSASDSQALAVASRFGLKPSDVGLGNMLPNADAVARAAELAGKSTGKARANAPAPAPYAGVPLSQFVHGAGGDTPANAGIGYRIGNQAGGQPGGLPFSADDLSIFNR